MEFLYQRTNAFVTVIDLAKLLSVRLNIFLFGFAFNLTE